MGTHPNVILLLVLTPQGLSRKTRKELVDEFGKFPEHLDTDLVIADKDYHQEVMEDDYDESWQISASEGDIIVFDLVTYGYGKKVSWESFEEQKKELEAWAIQVSEKYHCSWRIFVTANYW
jgi:hypothetical protein